MLFLPTSGFGFVFSKKLPRVITAAAFPLQDD